MSIAYAISTKPGGCKPLTQKFLVKFVFNRNGKTNIEKVQDL